MTQADKRQLPEGWRWVRLGEVIREAQPGFASGERDPNGVIQIRMNNLDTRGNVLMSEYLRVPADERTVARFQLERGDVLFNNTNSTELVGKSAMFPGFSEPVVYSNHFTRLRVVSGLLEPHYLAIWLVSQWQDKVFENLCNRWIGQSAVKNDKLLALEIPLPPLPEQRRIAAILAEQMTAVDKARAGVEVQLNAARRLPAAYLREVFDGNTAKGWARKKLGEICHIRLGKMLSPVSKTGTRPKPYLRNVNVQWGRFNLEDVAEMDFTESEEEKFALKTGDLMVCEGGEPGRAAVWGEQISPCCYQKALHRLRPIEDAVDPHFVMYRLWMGSFTGEFTGSNAKTTIAHLPAIRLAELSIGVPSLPEQKRIVVQIAERISHSGLVRSVLERQISDVNQLPAALLRRVFNGEL